MWKPKKNQQSEWFPLIFRVKVVNKLGGGVGTNSALYLLSTEMSIIFVYCGYNGLIVLTNILGVFVLFVFVSKSKRILT